MTESSTQYQAWTCAAPEKPSTADQHPVNRQHKAFIATASCSRPCPWGRPIPISTSWWLRAARQVPRSLLSICPPLSLRHRSRVRSPGQSGNQEAIAVSPLSSPESWQTQWAWQTGEKQRRAPTKEREHAMDRPAPTQRARGLASGAHCSSIHTCRAAAGRG